VPVSSSSLKPSTALIGVRSSWLIEAKKRERCEIACSSASACSSIFTACCCVCMWSSALSSAIVAWRASRCSSGASDSRRKPSGRLVKTASTEGG
jgi:hypothetical protein